MNSNQKRVFIVLLSISVIYFSIFIIPNNTGAKDQIMISLFEPDEFAQYPIVMNMLKPRDALDETILNFILYRHYYYGSPFYFSSALMLIPIKFFGNLRQTTQLNMLLLRQIISVLPMIVALLLLTYSQTKFKSYSKSIALYVLLLSVPAVVENNMWWHVDSLAVLFTVLTIFFLDMDELRFERNFYLAAVFTGLSTGTKVIGLFFFLTIPTYLLIGIIRGKLTWRKAILRGAMFVGVMAMTVFISNPFLVFPSQFLRMVRILTNQSESMYKGWTLSYAKGPGSWYFIIRELYGKLLFVSLAFVGLVLGILNSKKSVLHLLIATWSIPFGLYVLFTIAIKPTHFFLPILLPVYCGLGVLFDLPLFSISKRNLFSLLVGGVLLAIIGYQLTVYIEKDILLFRKVVSREEHEESLVFYTKIERDFISHITTDEKLVVFRDVRMYFPEDPKWIIRSYWNSNYSTIERIKPDLIILWSQRILDYTSEDAQKNAIDPVTFKDTYDFYMDANHDQLRGYRLVYRNEEGLFFASNAVYDLFFSDYSK